jgi:hypothetical protein
MIRNRSSYQIGLTCDFLRFALQGVTVTNFQNRNLAWLAEILRVPLAQAAGTSISMVMASENLAIFKKELNCDTMLSEYVEDANAAWARNYDAPECPVFEPLLDLLCQQDLIVGFEIPPSIKRYLHSNSKRYISLYIHPIRYLRDLCFGTTTNCPDILRVINAYVIDRNEIDRQAGRFSGLFTRLRLPACTLPTNVPLLIGQTNYDSVLINNGNFSDWENFRELITCLLSPFDTVAFLEHPYQLNSAKTLEFLRNTLQKNVIATRGNSYGMIFSNRQTPLVLTLSSSLAVEAESIGHIARYLLNDPRRKFLVEGIDQPHFAMLAHTVLDANFWSAILKGIKEEGPPHQEAGCFFLGDNFLRNSLEAWSFRSLQNGLTVEPSVRTLISSSSATPERLDQLAASFCGIEETEMITRLQASSQARNNGIDFRKLEPPVAPYQRVDLPINTPEGAHYLISGFHTAENWGVWSSEHRSSLLIPFSTVGSPYARLRIEIHIKVYSGIGNQSPVLRLSFNGHSVGFAFFRPPHIDMQRLIMELDAAPPFLQIDFELTDVQSPSVYSGSMDSRMLGFGLARVTVEHLGDAEEIRPAQECQLWGIDPNGDRPIQDVAEANTA